MLLFFLAATLLVLELEKNEIHTVKWLIVYPCYWIHTDTVTSALSKPV